jgi:cell division protein FtsL
MTWLAIKTLFFENGQKIIWVVAVLIVLYGGYQIRGIMAERDKALDNVANLQRAYLSLELEAESNREAAIEQLTYEQAALADKMNEVYANDEQAKIWADTVIPDSVLSLLR